MVVRPQRFLDMDPQAFSEAYSQTPLAVDHTLVGHPLLELDAIADLADRFPGKIERHRADLPLVMPGGAPELEGPPSETVRGIDDNGCWMVFWYIEQIPEYKELLDGIVDEAEASLGPRNAALIQREAFLFLSAPGAVTPVHFDPEHNFLLQIIGEKDMNICPFPSFEAEQRELERYYAGGHRNLEQVPSESQPFHLEPGKGVYVPSFMPHWVQNGPEASTSLSITFRSRASRRAERVQSVNAHLRQLGLSPRPPGSAPLREQAKELAWVTVTGAKRGMHRALAARRRHAPTSG